MHVSTDKTWHYRLDDLQPGEEKIESFMLQTRCSNQFREIEKKLLLLLQVKTRTEESRMEADFKYWRTRGKGGLKECEVKVSQLCRREKLITRKENTKRGVAKGNIL